MKEVGPLLVGLLVGPLLILLMNNKPCSVAMKFEIYPFERCLQLA